MNRVPDDSGEDSGESVAVPELAVEADGGEGAPDALTGDVVQLTSGDLENVMSFDLLKI